MHCRDIRATVFVPEHSPRFKTMYLKKAAGVSTGARPWCNQDPSQADEAHRLALQRRLLLKYTAPFAINERVAVNRAVRTRS
jgi:hypothetical protein